VRKTGGSEEALFAPDYGEEVDPSFSLAALGRMDASQTELVRAADEDGLLPPASDPRKVGEMRLRGLVEIFIPNLTPLGMAVRERLLNKEPDR
jgi:hypothetical protein